MTPKERAVMQQALDALEELFYSNSTKVAVEKYDTAHNALRETLAEQAEQEPVAKVGMYNEITAIKPLEFGTKLYTHPVRTKDLTDDEIDYLIDEACQTQMPYDMFARAVIAADREKNNV